MFAGILTLLMKVFGVFETLITKHYSKENVSRETSQRESDIQDEAELAAKMAANPDTKNEGISKMRDLISD